MKRFDHILFMTNMAQVTDMSRMFEYATSFNGDVTTWNTSHVRDFGFMFDHCETFNQDVSRWDVSGGQHMAAFQATFQATALSSCNKAAIVRSWADDQALNVDGGATLFPFDSWPRQCAKKTGCRVWETAWKGGCVQALWFDTARCMDGRLAELEGMDAEDDDVELDKRLAVVRPFGSAVPEHIAIVEGGCTPLPSFTQAAVAQYGAVIDAVSPIFVGLGMLDKGGLATHNIDSLEGGVAVLVDFDDADADLFTLRLMHGKGGSCTEPITVGVRNVNRGVSEDIDLKWETQPLSLKNITAGSRRGQTPRCHATRLTTTSIENAPVTELVFAQSGKGKDEPLFGLSWFNPGAPTPANTSTLPNITCSSNASLQWPFELKVPAEEELDVDAAVTIDAAPFALKMLFPFHAGTAVARGSLNATGAYRVRMSAHGHGVRMSTHVVKRKGGLVTLPKITLPSDFKGDVTFTASSLLG